MARTVLAQLSARTPPFVIGVYGITSICGVLDAACYLGLGHVFVEIMTGNLVYLAFSIGSIGNHQADTVLPAGVVLPYVVALGAFALGALGGGRLVRVGEAGRRAGFVIEWLLVVASLVATMTIHPRPFGDSRFVVVAILSFAMGIQNAVLRRWGIKDLATNVMTLTMTGLLADSTLAGGTHPRAGRRAASILIFVVSAGLGAFLVRYGVVWPLGVGLGVLTLALPCLLQPVEAAAVAPRAAGAGAAA